MIYCWSCKIKHEEIYVDSEGRSFCGKCRIAALTAEAKSSKNVAIITKKALVESVADYQQRIAEAVAAETERCATVCRDIGYQHFMKFQVSGADVASQCEHAIRERKP